MFKLNLYVFFEKKVIFTPAKTTSFASYPKEIVVDFSIIKFQQGLKKLFYCNFFMSFLKQF